MRKIPRQQIAALPVRIDSDGSLKVLLVTSRETRRWVIPKGWPFRRLPDHRAAGEEAWEEAGIRGKLEKKALGVFHYDKRRNDGIFPITVTVYRMLVLEVLDVWPEAHQRERAWFSVADAAAAVQEPELKAIILTLQAPAQPDKPGEPGIPPADAV